jgi:hypothetical protein
MGLKSCKDTKKNPHTQIKLSTKKLLTIPYRGNELEKKLLTMELLITLARKIWKCGLFFVSLRVDGWE